MGAEVIPKLTFEQFRELPTDGKRYELIQGKVHATTAPAARRQFALQNLYESLGPCVHKNHLGEVVLTLLDVRLGEETVLQPDLIFISHERAGIIQENWIEGSPDLAVEVLSPSTAGHQAADLCPGRGGSRTAPTLVAPISFGDGDRGVKPQLHHTETPPAPATLSSNSVGNG